MLSTDRRTRVRAVGVGAAFAAFATVTGAPPPPTATSMSSPNLVSKPEGGRPAQLVEFVAGARKEPGCQPYSLLEDRKHGLAANRSPAPKDHGDLVLFQELARLFSKERPI